ncbi:putative zinc-binding metallopeptidase [Rhizobium sp. L1K21]|uniref:zinc-binding metallopeptidase family protein n=1 Tax=Rhizobium sp. L1K21 TaxID=2954933 RepID=UPI002092FB2B|nr:putative zinc-binding metallopeptidase [Rhizobium sp. L1K21]MCO6184671.1 putative zinc-binding peptidase [Rhizobium sp. L1K21]
MKIFQCTECGQPVHYDNTVCTACGASLSYDPASFEMVSYRETPPANHKLCANREIAICNWLVPETDEDEFCQACRLNLKIPNLADPDKVDKWQKLEAAKRYFLYGLMRLGLPIITRTEDPEHGLAFQLLSNDGPEGDIMTGHDNGLITINIDEADDPEREARREALGENFRTLIGHFRHESGHYYWNLFILGADGDNAARKTFGDAREDYAEALQRYYDSGPPPDWSAQYISAYASSHAWEDFAETWAHYLHIVDGLETALCYGLWPTNGPDPFNAYESGDTQMMVEAWTELSLAVNAINRSVGQPDLYPFIFSPPVIDKLDFMHDLVATNSKRNKT